LYSNEKTIWKQKVVSLNTVNTLSIKIAESLRQEQTFCLFLRGPMGSGKTTIVRMLLHELGLPSRIPVTSPTFSLMVEYKIRNEFYAHMDLYRLQKNLNEEPLIDINKYRGIMVEWPENLTTDFLLPTTHSLIIDYNSNNSSRDYSFLMHSSTKDYSLTTKS